MNVDYWTDVLMSFAGFMGSVLFRALVEGRTNQNLPNPVYAAPALVGGLAMGRSSVAMGGALYAVDELSMAVSVQGMLVGAVSGNGGGA